MKKKGGSGINVRYLKIMYNPCVVTSLSALLLMYTFRYPPKRQNTRNSAQKYLTVS